MSGTATVKVSKRNQISLPSAARKALDIRSGDRLVISVQGDLLVLVPRPNDYVERMAGLHKEIWEGIDALKYVDSERKEWQ